MKCRAYVYRRDTYRRCGGPRHFKMHYAEGRCLREGKGPAGLCAQHAKLHEAHPNYLRFAEAPPAQALAGEEGRDE